jgi:cytochrome P450
MPGAAGGEGHRSAAFLITRFADTRAALSDPRLSKDARHGAAELEAAGIAEAYIGERALLDGSMLGADPPEHTRLRRLVAGQFTGRRTAQLAPRIQQLSDQLIDGFPPGTAVDGGFGHVEFMAGFANPLPARHRRAAGRAARRPGTVPHLVPEQPSACTTRST